VHDGDPGELRRDHLAAGLLTSFMSFNQDRGRVGFIRCGDRGEHFSLVEQHALVRRDFIRRALLRGTPVELCFEPGDLLLQQQVRFAVLTDLGFELRVLALQTSLFCSN
jgi:hypothetical protein